MYEGFEVPALAELHLHACMFTLVGKWPRVSWLSNRRGADHQFLQFAIVQGLDPKDVNWGLPEPNLEAAYKSLGKYGKFQPVVVPDAWLKAFEMFTAEFFPFMHESRIISTEEAISEIDLTTSVGFPYNLDFKDKREWLASATAKDDISRDWEFLLKKAYVFLWSSQTKEEVRDMKKIQENNLRTFTASNAPATINGTRLFWDMNQKFYASAMQTASTVGKDVFHRGWNDIYQRLKVYDEGFEADISQMDSSFFQLAFAAICQFRINCLREEDRTEENVTRIQTYYRNIVWSVVISADGLIVRKSTGNPSGSVNTITDNTMVLYLWLAYCWVLTAPPKRQSHDEFRKAVVLCLTGDDNTWTSDPLVGGFFNVASVAKVMATLGVKVTTPCENPRPVEELQYLSRSFNTILTDPYGVQVRVPVLDREKMLTSLKYSEKPLDPVYSLLRAVGIYQVTWGDVKMRKFMKQYIGWLITEYGGVCSEDPDWRQALAGYKPDDFMLNLYTMRVHSPGKFVGYKVQEKDSP